MVMKNRQKKAASTNKPAAESMQLDIDFHFGSEIQAIPANQLAAMQDAHTVRLAFFDIRPPLLFGSSEQKEMEIRKIKSIRANCVAEIVIPLTNFPEFAAVIQEQLSKVEQRIQRILAKRASTEKNNGHKKESH